MILQGLYNNIMYIEVYPYNMAIIYYVIMQSPGSSEDPQYKGARAGL